MIKIDFLFFLGCVFCLIVTPLHPASVPEEPQRSPFLAAENAWRAERDARMRSSESWLSIAGLFWLNEGENTFGTGRSCTIRLPENSAPVVTGVFTLKRGRVFLTVSPGVSLKVNGKAVSSARLKGDDRGDPDIIEINALRMWVIKRGERYALRLRDLNHPSFLGYTGLDYFPPETKFRIEADFVPYSEPKTVSVMTEIGTQTEMTSLGTVHFPIGEEECRLVAFGSGPESKILFLIFKDETNGHETYESGRFLTASLLESGKVDLNFNRAYNPPCAYTPYATCPLPPLENHLEVRIEAGEKMYPGDESRR